MTAFDSGFSCVAGRTKCLQIIEHEGEVRRIAHGLDVIDFQPSTRAAFQATKLIASECFEAQGFPASCSCYTFRVSVVFFKMGGRMLKTVIVGAVLLMRLACFAAGAYLIFYGVDLLLSGTAETIPLISISPNGIEGRELPIAAFVSVIGLTLIALALFARGSYKDGQADVHITR